MCEVSNYFFAVRSVICFCRDVELFVVCKDVPTTECQSEATNFMKIT